MTKREWKRRYMCQRKDRKNVRWLFHHMRESLLGLLRTPNAVVRFNTPSAEDMEQRMVTGYIAVGGWHD